MIIWQLMLKGGYVMWPILLCSIVSVAIFIERWKTYSQVKANLESSLLTPPRDFNGSKDEKKEILQSNGNIIVSHINEYLNYLEAIVTVSPLLGLLGTVTGMINSFNVLAISEGQPFAITGGVSEALIATAFGLCVAIIALILHTILVQKQNNIINEMELLSDRYINELMRG